MQTWAIIAQKGGQSKTTIATGFAVEAARAGAAVVILDADDRQGSALYWSERRGSDESGCGWAIAIPSMETQYFSHSQASSLRSEV